MSTSSRAGFNIVELAVVTVIVMLAGLVVMPACSTAVCGANGAAVGTRGRDIYVAITGANTERVSVGLPPLWPSDVVFVTNAVDDDISSVTFTNSTDYFKCLYDESHAGTGRWSPFVADFDYSKLAGAGVPTCLDGHLTPDCNMWTIAKNVCEKIDDILPVLLTRNVDATSLAARITEKDFDKTLRFDPAWTTPFGHSLYCLVRKGGAIFKAREKYMSYRINYQGVSFDTTADERGQVFARPLKYLTPTHEVVPGEQVYRAGAAANKALFCRVKTRLGHYQTVLTRFGWQVGALLGAFYGIAVCAHVCIRLVRRARPLLSGFLVVFIIFHWAATTLHATFLFSLPDMNGYPPYWLLLALAVLAQAAGVAFVKGSKGVDAAVRTRGVKWLVAAPLLVYGFAAMSAVILIFLSQSIDMGSALSALVVLATLVIVVTTVKINVVRSRCKRDDEGGSV